MFSSDVGAGPKRVRLEEESRKSKSRRRGADLRIPYGRFVKNQTPECGVKFHVRISSSTLGPRKSPRNVQVSRDVDRPVTIKARVIEKMFSFREASASFQAEHFFVRIRVIGLLVTSPANGGQSDNSFFFLVWRRPGERYAQCMMAGKESFGGGTLMVWGGINPQAKRDLVHVGQGALNAHRYITQILEPHDNARPHVARVVTRYFEEVHIQKFDWPARSPDCNPIEHVCDELGRSIKARRNRPQTRNQLLQYRKVSIMITVSEATIVSSSSIGGIVRSPLLPLPGTVSEREYRIVILDRTLSSGRPFQAERLLKIFEVVEVFGFAELPEFSKFFGFAELPKFSKISEAGEVFQSCRSFRSFSELSKFFLDLPSCQLAKSP
ncbi:hypothetical protein GEV33_009166 [Tenebrio molitor]|uniref:Uncharacterized protein n=1 Tax=Tenebrio molitor TaxID=7067 RepID=A0A8J6L8Q3_TENMO|nr:hypothetical protein GEV33_009166 [Tenebrio molitor]